MNTNRIFVALLSGLLTIDEDQVDDAYGLIAQCHRPDRIDVVRRIGAATLGEDNKIPFRQWVDEQRAQGVTSVRVAVQDHANTVAGGDRERQLDQGYAARLSILMQVDTTRHPPVFVQVEMTAPRLALTASRLVELVEAQNDPDSFWMGIQAELADYRDNDDFDDLEPEQVRAYLLSFEGQGDWEAIAEQLFRHVQVDALASGQPLVIPDGFLEYIEQQPAVDEALEPTVWLEAIDDDVSARALLGLIEAQDFAPAIWQFAANRKRLKQELDASVELDEFPTIAASAWPRFLARLPDDEVWRVADVLLELVRIECAHRGVQPRIPEELADFFGPDDEDRRWLELDERLEHGLSWAIRETDEPITLRILDSIDGQAPLASELQMAQARQRFIDAAIVAEDYADRVDSPFLPAFGTARRLAILAGDAGPLDMAELASPDLDWPPDLWEVIELTLVGFSPFAWRADRLLGLAAISVMEVFGHADASGAQGFEDEDEDLVRSVTSTLYSALNRYFEALVSIES